jgi:hypothetical protein
MTRWLLSVAVFLTLLSTGFAADLSKVDRTIAKEPKYVGKPEYCLLVFGPDAKNRIWLVRDGDTLYVDKNGDGHLTDPRDKIAAEKDDSNLAFYAGAVRFGKLEHRNLTVRACKLSVYGDDVRSHPVSRAALEKDKGAYLMSVNAEIEVPGLTGDGDGGRLTVGARFDADGPLLFADTPANAPVLHFGGPLHLSGDAKPTLYRGVVHDLMLTVGTPGLGPGTFANVGYEKLIPEDAFVVAEAEFPPNKPGHPPVKQRFELKERC